VPLERDPVSHLDAPLLAILAKQAQLDALGGFGPQ
jgi:hypothetical protein